jgi:hypothetical protein
MKIVTLDKSVDLWLSYSWGNFKQGICGHLFEVIEYYWILKDHFKTKILINEILEKEKIKILLESKYNFTSDEINDILNNIEFYDNPSIIKGSNILIADGNFKTLKSKYLYFDKILMFPCSDLTYYNLDNVYPIQDDRMYKSHQNGIHYIKKILFSRFKEIENLSQDLMMYITRNVRELETDELKEMSLCYDKKISLITNVDYKDEDLPEYNILRMPVQDIMSKFGTYIYTPIHRKKDCSPRFVAECEFYNKKVIYHNINYLDEDHGLRLRIQDIENDFKSLFLDENDPIIDIIKGII